MDILKMTVGQCLKNEKIKSLLYSSIPELKNFPLMLFSGKSCAELVQMGIKQGLFTREDGEYMVKKINAELEKLGL